MLKHAWVAVICAITLWSVLPVSGCDGEKSSERSEEKNREEVIPRKNNGSLTFAERLAEAAIERTQHEIRYDPKYVKIEYPGGDVPAGTGVCTDVIIRSYRTVGLDLQKLVHEDMKANFDEYPKLWNLTRPDPNIDHRRVPNLMKFFSRHGGEVAVTQDKKDYLPGDVVAWDLGKGVKHIGLIAGVSESYRVLAVHNIGAGPQLEDCLFNWEIIGHYRYPVRNEETGSRQVKRG